MVWYPTSCMNSTDSRTRILALIIDTSLVIWTVSIGDTFRLALNVWIASIVEDAPTGGCPSLFRTFSIDTTRWRIAGLNNFYWSGRCSSVTLNKRISSEALVADTYWYMISDVALGINATETRARILTLSVDASFVNWAVLVYDTFRATVGWWTNHFRQARTLTSVSNNSWRVRVRSTGVWITGILLNYWCCS